MASLKQTISNFISQQCPSFTRPAKYKADAKDKRPQRPDTNGYPSKVRRAPNGAIARPGSNDSLGSKSKRSAAALFHTLRSSRPPTRREQLLFVVCMVCLFQMAWMRQAQSNSLIMWVRDSFEEPDPGQPPTRHAVLPATEVLRTSPDACAEALRIPRVALMFLTTGNLHHEPTWRLWFQSAAGVLPAQAMAASVCQQDAQEGSSSNSALGASRLQGANACRRNSTNPIDSQHLFSVYVHAPPSFSGYDDSSLWDGRMVRHRVQTSWGAHTLVEATRHLMWEAFRDPLNTRFLLLSETDVPLYDPLTLWQQLQAETRSRLDTCKHQETSPWRWDPRMETARMKFHTWRKSPQWLSLKREHVALVLRDEEVYRKFERHCWSAWDGAHARWHRDCFSDEHYFATLMAVEGKDNEGVCGVRGVSYTEWESNSAHPKSFAAKDIDVEFFKRARTAQRSATGQPTPSCDWAAAQQAAAALFVPVEAAFGAEGVDMCGRMWRQPPTFKARMPETCFLTARKFPVATVGRVRQVFLQCGTGVNLLRQDVCEAEGGIRCGRLWGRIKGLVSRDPCKK